MRFNFFDNRAEAEKSPLNQDRGYLFGDGFFTTGIIKNGALRHEEKHFQRFKLAAEKLKFKPLDFSVLKYQIEPCISGVDAAAVRITISRQQQSRGYAFSSDASLNVTLQLSVLPDLPQEACHLFFAQVPVSVNPYLAGIKHLNRLDNVLASSEVSTPYQESLLAHDDQVICGSRSNLFAFIDGGWQTPLLSHAGINGITRQRLIALMKLNDIPILETRITPDKLRACQAAFVTNSLFGLWPVAKIEQRTLATQLSENLQSQLSFKR